MLLALAVMLVLAPTNAFAVPTKTVRNFPGTTKNKVAMAKATEVKRGTTVLKFKKGSGLGVIKFTPTRNGKYTFTFAQVKGLNTSKDVVGIGQFYYMNPYKKTAKSVKLAEGVRPYFPLLSKGLADGAKVTSGGKTYKRLATRRMTLTLKKGKTIYILTSFENEDSNPTAATCRLKIQ